MSYRVMKRHGGSQCIFPVKETNLKRLHTGGSHYMTFLKRQNSGNSKKISGFIRIWEGLDKSAEYKSFKDSETICMILQ